MSQMPTLIRTHPTASGQEPSQGVAVRAGAPTKLCSCCRDPKSLDQFAKRLTASDGLQSRCRECNSKDKARRRANGLDLWDKAEKRRAASGSGVIAPTAYARGFRWGASPL